MYDIIKVADNVYDEFYNEKCLIDFIIPRTGHAVPVLIWFHGGGLSGGSRHEAFLSRLASEHGIAVASADYRMYPEAQYPDYLNDASRAVEFVWNYGQSTELFNRFFIGGAEAGAYIAMMLYFNSVYMKEFVMTPDMFHGFIFDGGYPTVPPRVLEERCLDSRAVRIDKSAPMYYLDAAPSHEGARPPVLLVTAEREIAGIGGANDLLRDAMLSFGYREERVERVVMRGYGHGEYRTVPNAEGGYPICPVFADFIGKRKAERSAPHGEQD